MTYKKAMFSAYVSRYALKRSWSNMQVMPDRPEAAYLRNSSATFGWLPNRLELIWFLPLMR